jgi:hypothetical protein
MSQSPFEWGHHAVLWTAGFECTANNIDIFELDCPGGNTLKPHFVVAFLSAAKFSMTLLSILIYVTAQKSTESRVRDYGDDNGKEIIINNASTSNSDPCAPRR